MLVDCLSSLLSSLWSSSHFVDLNVFVKIINLSPEFLLLSLNSGSVICEFDVDIYSTCNAEVPFMTCTMISIFNWTLSDIICWGGLVLRLFPHWWLLSSADKLCKQFGPRSGLTKCWAWSGSKLFDTLIVLTLVLLNPDIPCLCKQCRSRSVGFGRSQLIWICTVCH